MRYIVLLLSLLLSCSLIGQERLHNGFKFREGFYMDIEDWKSNWPEHKLTDLPILEYQLDYKGNLLLLSKESLAAIEAHPQMSLEKLWGLSINGVPYVKIDSEGDQIFFVRFYLMGSICYYSYTIFRDKDVVMNIYNPKTGDIVAEKIVVNQEKELKEFILNYKTEEEKALTVEDLSTWIEDDPGLVKSLKKLQDEEREQKLFKIIRIYNDRHQVLVGRKNK